MRMYLSQSTCVEVDTYTSKQGLKGIWVPLPIPGYAASSALPYCHPGRRSGAAGVDEGVVDAVW